MIFLISAVLALTFAFLCGQTLRKRPVPFYLGAVAVAAAGMLLSRYGGTLPGAVKTWILPVLTGGGLEGALFAIVMFTGALPNGSGLIRRLMPIRGELSILACILTAGHNITYGKTYFFTLFTNPGKLSVWHILAASCSLVMILLMLPLFITSFKCIRRKMRGRTWKKLQRLAYGFYALLYIHVMLLNLPGMIAGRAGNLLNGFVYSTVFISYFICRILKQAAKQKGAAKMLVKKQAAGAVCAVFASLILTVCLSGGALQTTKGAVRDTEEKSGTLSVSDTESAGTYPDGSLTGGTYDDGIHAGETYANGTFTGGTYADETLTGGTHTGGTYADETHANGTFTDKTYTNETHTGGTYADGTYTGSAMGMNAPVTVRVTIESDQIREISVLSHQDDEEYFSDALAVIDRILNANSTEVDTVSGATWSSGGILDAVDDALKKAGK